MFENLTFEDWAQSVAPKVCGTLNLHHLVSNQQVDFFITLSSISCVIGNIGQANYAVGNAFMDAFMSWRAKQNMAASSINIGLVSDGSGVGESLESPEERRRR